MLIVDINYESDLYQYDENNFNISWTGPPYWMKCHYLMWIFFFYYYFYVTDLE